MIEKDRQECSMNLWNLIVDLLTLPFQARPCGEKYTAFLERTNEPNLLKNKNGSFISIAEHTIEGVAIELFVMNGLIIQQIHTLVPPDRVEDLVASALCGRLKVVEDSTDKKRWEGKNRSAEYDKRKQSVSISTL